MHYKCLNNNLRTFVEFLDQSIYALFCPAPRIFTFAPPRPAPLEKAPPAHPWFAVLVVVYGMFLYISFWTQVSFILTLKSEYASGHV